MSPFHRKNHWGLLLVEWLAVLVLVVLAVVFTRTPRSGRSGEGPVSDSLFRRQRRPLPASRTYTYAVPETPVESFPFDPNTADSTTLLRLGLAPWQVQSIYKYRAKHGRYHTPEDFQHLPGMTPELWERLGKYVTIAEKFRYMKPTPRKVAPRTETDPIPSESKNALTTETPVIPAEIPKKPDSIDMDTARRYPVKFRELTPVDINTADTTLLKRIPNIGSFRAGQIVAYREKLGGYIHLEQVMEACEMPDEVLEWFTLVPQPVRTINVNTLSTRQLMRHPYLSFYQARSIVEHRREHGPFHQPEDLLGLEEFTAKDIDRLRPYLQFE